jgi:hypothetical protein
MSNTNWILGLGVLICAYSAQYWAKKCCDELREIRDELKRLRK